MNRLMKAIVLSAGLISVAGLTAHATTPQETQASTTHEKHHKHDGHAKHMKHMKNMTDEERAKKREQMQQRHAERKAKYETLNKACEGKVGQSISVKVGEKTVEGSCEVRFKPAKTESKTATPAS